MIFKKGLYFLLVFTSGVVKAGDSPQEKYQAWEVYQPVESPCYLQTHSIDGQKAEMVAGIYPQVKSPVVVYIAFENLPENLVEVQIIKASGQKTFFILKPYEGRLWPLDEASDYALIKALKEGRFLEVMHKNERVARFSLKGFTKALSALDTRCRAK